MPLHSPAFPPRQALAAYRDGRLAKGVRGEAQGQLGEAAAYQEYADRLGLSVRQTSVVVCLAFGLCWAIYRDAELTLILTIFAIQTAFLGVAAWRTLLLAASLHPPAPVAAPESLPRYAILVALYREAEVAEQLVERLAKIDYPTDRLEGFLILEDDDEQTRAAIEKITLPSWLRVLVAPDGAPRTKPRALNFGLAQVSGELVTVYDAEDDPDPRQLREAAARFEADRSRDVWALQAPLRIRDRANTHSPFLDRQFEVEYASLFEVTLPGLARLGLPFPLGGTSNHFRVDALRSVGGWDAYNVTEDADLGFRLWRAGGRLGVLESPTHEPPPGSLEHWLPQRTRWLKGYMQTWGVHTRDVRGLGWRGGISLTMTLGVAIGSAALHAPSIAWLLTTVLIAMAGGLPPHTPTFAMCVLAVGSLAAWVNAAIGCRRAAKSYTLADLISAPGYWSLLSLAFVHAVWRLIREPFAWDKTRHFAEVKSVGVAMAGREPG